MSDPRQVAGPPVQRGGLNGQWSGRMVGAVLIDLVLSLGALFGARPALTAAGQDTSRALLYGLAGLFVISFVNRVVLQWIFRASIGKLITGLRVIRPWDGRRPTLFDLLRSWVSSIGYALVEQTQTADASWRFLVGTVTREQLRAYR